MLVFLSDVHLTDGSLGQTINPRAFAKFSGAVEEMARSRRPQRGKASVPKIEIVLLGDIFDVLRSHHWVRSGTRPWCKGKAHKRCVMDITEGICGNPANKQAAAHLQRFRQKMKTKGVPVKITYIVGNHDRLINTYPETRIKAARFLGLDRPGQHKVTRLPTRRHWREYKAIARHGHIYDPFSSLGDAVVTDLTNRFPQAVEDEIGPDTDPLLISRLKEIDNVCPLLDIPLWVHSTCRDARTSAAAEKTKEVWNRLVDEFLKLAFVRKQDRPWRFNIVDALQTGLQITKYLPFKYLVQFPLRAFEPNDDDYIRHAVQERPRPDFVLYGHTHAHRIIPLGDSLYINSGTWRKIHLRAIQPGRFASWHVMTFVVLYAEGEHQQRRFEVWSGALG